jgi:hypothetical protein
MLPEFSIRLLRYIPEIDFRHDCYLNFQSNLSDIYLKFIIHNYSGGGGGGGPPPPPPVATALYPTYSVQTRAINVGYDEPTCFDTIYWLILEDIGLILTLFKIFISEFATSCSSIKVRLQYSGAEMSFPVISFLNTVGSNKNKLKTDLIR